MNQVHKNLDRLQRAILFDKWADEILLKIEDLKNRNRARCSDEEPPEWMHDHESMGFI